MELCSDYHEEIVYEGRRCPLCVANKTIEELEDKNRLLQEQLDDLESEKENE